MIYIDDLTIVSPPLQGGGTAFKYTGDVISLITSLSPLQGNGDLYTFNDGMQTGIPIIGGGISNTKFNYNTRFRFAAR